MHDTAPGRQEQLYTLRIWRDDRGLWRASVRNLRTRESRYFGSLDSLILFLTRRVHP